MEELNGSILEKPQNKGKHVESGPWTSGGMLADELRLAWSHWFLARALWGGFCSPPLFLRWGNWGSAPSTRWRVVTQAGSPASDICGAFSFAPYASPPFSNTVREVLLVSSFTGVQRGEVALPKHTQLFTSRVDDERGKLQPWRAE